MEVVRSANGMTRRLVEEPLWDAPARRVAGSVGIHLQETRMMFTVVQSWEALLAVIAPPEAS
jgi:hypothetical protein